MNGIGITTYGRNEHYKLFLSQLGKFKLPGEFGIVNWEIKVVAEKGIANAKNKCLIHLQNCDYIFLFDDDCFPIKEGWAEYFIEESKRTGQQHFMYLKQTSMINIIEIKDGIKIYDNCAGCFMFFTKECIDKVGGYCKDYDIYGFEHAGYSDRIHKAGLTPMGAYTCPERTREYIYSLDYDNYLDFGIIHKPSLKTSEIKESIQKNNIIYLRERETIYQPLPKTCDMLIKYATRGRPEKFKAAIKNIQQTISAKNYFILVSADMDDMSMNNDLIKAFIKEQPNCDVIYGESPNKVHAINRDMEMVEDWSMLINMSDDMTFTVNGWDEKMKESIKNKWGGSTDYFAHFSDGYVKEKLPTMSIMGYEYYKRFNYIYHRDYASVSCDAEAMYVAQMLDRYHYFPEIYFLHLHPANVPTPTDATYMRNNIHDIPDTDIYFKRYKLGFEVKNPVNPLPILNIPDGY